MNIRWHWNLTKVKLFIYICVFKIFVHLKKICHPPYTEERKPIKPNNTTSNKRETEKPKEIVTIHKTETNELPFYCKIERYNQTMDFPDWFRDFESLIILTETKEEKCQHILRLHLDDFGKDILDDLPADQTATVALLKTNLLRRMPKCEDSELDAQDALSVLIRGNRDIDNYALLVKKTVRKAYPTLSEAQRDQMQARAFIAGLAGEIQRRVEIVCPTTFAHTVTLAKKQERFLSMKEPRKSEEQWRQEVDNLHNKIKYLEKNSPPTGNPNPNYNNYRNTGESEVQCSQYELMGHLAIHCGRNPVAPPDANQTMMPPLLPPAPSAENQNNTAAAAEGERKPKQSTNDTYEEPCEHKPDMAPPEFNKPSTISSLLPPSAPSAENKIYTAATTAEGEWKPKNYIPFSPKATFNHTFLCQLKEDYENQTQPEEISISINSVMPKETEIKPLGIPTYIKASCNSIGILENKTWDQILKIPVENLSDCFKPMKIDTITSTSHEIHQKENSIKTECLGSLAHSEFIYRPPPELDKENSFTGTYLLELIYWNSFTGTYLLELIYWNFTSRYIS